jgi:cystathionine beta-synthase
MNQSLNTHQNILQLIGNTPLIKLNNSAEGLKGDFFAKFEGFNPGHSNKDRIAIHIIDEAEKQGILKPGATIIETTSGNTGFSLAMVSMIKGYNCILAVSSKSSKDKINMLSAMGAQVHVCPANVAADDPRSYYQVAKRLHSETKESVYINQYFNDLNVDAHYRTTGPEIWNQTKGEITHLVASSGTGGTISGCAKYLKEQNPNIQIIGVPTATHFDLIDHFVKVTDEESAHTARKITRSEGMFVGYTSGAAMQAVYQLAEENYFKKDSKVVVIFPDHGSRYLSKIYSEDWMAEQGFFDASNESQHIIKYIKEKASK